MSFWTNCNKCGSRVYMSKVQPPNEYYSRWLPFEDELLIDCHLENCFPTLSSKSNVATKTKSKKASKIMKCPICDIDVREDRLDKHTLKVHSNKQNFKLIECPICKVMVRKDRLNKHTSKVH